MNKLKSWINTIKQNREKDTLFRANEIQTNKLGTLILGISGLVMLVIIVLSYLDIFPVEEQTIVPPMLSGIIEVAILAVISYWVKFDTWWLRILLIVGMIFVYARIDSMLTHKVSMIMAIPVVFSSRYFTRHITVFTTIVSILIFAVSTYVGATEGMVDINIVTMAEGTTMTATGGFLGDAVINAGVADEMLRRNAMLYNYIPRLMMFSIIATISINLTHRGRDLIIYQGEQAIRNSRMELELDTGRRIQEAMVPNVFPPFPDRKEFDIYACMEPAKKVGGDLYDFFIVSPNHICLVIADVSGKGIPAALFMMASRIIIKTMAKKVSSPAGILSNVNNATCSNNKEEMFLTCWLGILDLRTGVLTASNAGHEYPFVKTPDGNFELLKDKHGFILGGMKHMNYEDYEVQMKPGSKIFVYTDGLPESKNSSGEQFGIERAGRTINKYKDGTPEEILNGVRKDVAEFVGEEERFDDMTMMCLQYNGTDFNDLTVDATVDNIKSVTGFINRKLDTAECSDKARKQIAVVVDELFGNIARYAYGKDGGKVDVIAELNEDKSEITIVLKDRGIPFNPLEKEEPDTDASAGDREVGGLGIFLVRNMMDDMTYERKDDQNILTIRKKLRG